MNSTQPNYARSGQVTTPNLFEDPFLNYTTASPLNIGPVDFGLNDLKENSEILKRLLTLPYRKIGTCRIAAQYFPVYRTGTRSGVIFVIFEGQLVVYIKYGLRKLKYLPEAITQFILWRKQDLSISATFTSNLFFKVVLPITGSVMSDKEQTVYGKNFWGRRLDEAVSRGYSVSLVDLSGQHIYSVNSSKVLQNLLKKAWGTGKLDTPDHKDQKWLNLRWVISKKENHAK